MLIKESQPECCVEYEQIPKNINCLLPDIRKELKNLICLHRKSFVRSSRLAELSKPVRRYPRYIPVCPCKFKKPIEIIRLDEVGHTRTEQLAYPTVRRLLLFKKDAMKILSPERILNLNRLIRKSLLSLYSRLGNVQPPEKVEKIRKWTRSEWASHTKKLAKLAKPKVLLPAPITISVAMKTMPFKKMKRYKYLAQPKKHKVIEKSEWALTTEMKNHKPSERTILLAKPIVRDTTNLLKEFPAKIPIGVLKYKTTKRLTDLAQPNSRRVARIVPSDLKENPFAVSPLALKGKPSKRITELAEPKEYENKNIREDPYKISPTALKAKASPRVCELAQPKKV